MRHYHRRFGLVRFFDLANPTDTIRLVKSIFTALTTGTLTAAQWENGDGVASLATHRILLDNSTGNLYYDSDGTGAAARVQFASLDVADLAGISNADFTVTLV